MLVANNLLRFYKGKRSLVINVEMKATIAVEEVICIQNLTLIIVCLRNRGWQFSYINSKGRPLKCYRVFSNALAAKRFAKQWLYALLQG